MDNQNGFQGQNQNNQSPYQPQYQNFDPNGPHPAVVREKKIHRKITKKIGWIIGIGVIMVLAIAGFLVYNLWYQNPHKVIFDAVNQAIVAKSHNYKGSFVYESKNGNNVKNYSLKVDFDLAGVGVKSAGVAKINFVSDGLELKLDAEAKGDDSGNVYIKASKVEENIDRYIAKNPQYQPIKDAYSDLIKKIDGKWLQYNYLKNISDEKDKKIAECKLNVAKKYTNDESFKRQVADIYRNNQFLTISDSSQKASSQFIYGISGDENKGREFLNKLSDLDISKEYNDCGGTTIKEDLDGFFDIDKNESGIESEQETTTFYINKISHKLEKVTSNFVGKDGEATLNGDIGYDVVYDSLSDIEMPKDAISVESLAKDIEASNKKLMDTYASQANASNDEDTVVE